MNVIPLTHEDRVKLLNLGIKRFQSSATYHQSRRDDWARYYKLYRAASDEEQESEETNIFLPYAYGAVEAVVARTAEPILQKFPIRTAPKKREHQKSAENFDIIKKNYFQTSDFQLDFIEGEREKVITGSSWECYEWANDWQEGRRWGDVDAKDEQGTPFKQSSEVPFRYPYKVGFQVRCPSIFNVFPQPGIKKLKDMKWIVEQVPSVMVDELRRQMYKDPKDGQMKPVYDLTQFDEEHRGHVPGSITPTAPTFNSNGDVDTGIKSVNSNDPGVEPDVDMVHLLNIYEDNRIFTILQGHNVVRCVEMPYQYPGLKWNIKVYTSDKESLYGIGIIQPAEHLFYELNDFHNISMQNANRIVNKMLAYHEEFVKYPDDFKPRAGGKIRVKGNSSVQGAIMSVDQPSVIGDMLAVESNTKGLLENNLSIADLSPGVEGTKAYHKTASGLMEIQNNLARRFSINRRLTMANFQSMLNSMYYFYDQFLFEKTGFDNFATQSGTRSQIELSREDIQTDGLGFNFIIEEDPSFGDIAVQRDQNMFLISKAMESEQFRIATKNPNMPELNMKKFWENALESFLKFDTTEYFMEKNASRSPDEELSMMMQGIAVKPSVSENITEHLTQHIQQLADPRLLDAVKTGKLPREVLQLIVQHKDQTLQLMAAILQKPEILAEIQFENKVAGGQA